MSVTKPSHANRERRLWHLRRLSSTAKQGFLQVGQRLLPCAVGRSGVKARKREGDGATPLGTWLVRCVLYRPDQVCRPVAPGPVKPIRRNDRWCDAPRDRNYNRAIRHPYPASAERLWREDDLYDVVLVLGYNDRPRVHGRGSAIFIHLARPQYAATEGCIALSRRDLRLLLATMRPLTAVRIHP